MMMLSVIHRKIKCNIIITSSNLWMYNILIAGFLIVSCYSKSIDNSNLNLNLNRITDAVDVASNIVVEERKTDHIHNNNLASNRNLIKNNDEINSFETDDNDEEDIIINNNNNDIIMNGGIGAGGGGGGGGGGSKRDNITFSTILTTDIFVDNSLLNNFMNISNSVPGLIEYYELDDDVSASVSSSSLSSASSSSVSSLNIIVSATQSPSPLLSDIYPDPEEIDRKIKIHNMNNEALLLHQLSSVSATKNNHNNKDFDIRDNNNDFKGHDFIDNIMYIYYGSNNTLKNSIGSSVVIGGSVLALAAQILCSILMILRNRTLRRQNALFYIFLNFTIILLLSNLIFILGVQSTKNEFRCGMVAILLHYLHLCTTFWGLIYIYIIYDYIVNDCGINLKYNYFMAYGVPAVYVLFSCAISSTSYEIIEYCWMSVQRGMIINFMIPVSGIIVVSTIIGTLCLREIATKQREVIAESIENILDNAAKCHEINPDTVTIETDKCCEWDDRNDDCNNISINKNKNDFYDSKFDLGVLSIVDLSLQSSANSQDFSDFKHSIKFLLFFQPAFAVCWFFSVIALENRESCIMPTVFVISYNILNWYLLIRSPYLCPIIQDQYQTDKSQIKDNCSNNGGDETNHHSLCTDTIPLLCTPTSLQQQNQKANIIEDCMMNEVQLNISTWTDSIGDISCNIDSISTISS